MKKIFLSCITLILLSTGCSKSDDSQDSGNIIIAKKYGITLRSNNTNESFTFNFKLSDSSTNEIYHEGSNEVGDSYTGFTYAVTEKELKNDLVKAQVTLTSAPKGTVHCFFHIINDDMYLDVDQNPDAWTIFTLNTLNLNQNNNTFEATFPLKGDQSFWIKNDGSFGN